MVALNPLIPPVHIDTGHCPDPCAEPSSHPCCCKMHSALTVWVWFFFFMKIVLDYNKKRSYIKLILKIQETRFSNEIVL